MQVKHPVALLAFQAIDVEQWQREDWRSCVSWAELTRAGLQKDPDAVVSGVRSRIGCGFQTTAEQHQGWPGWQWRCWCFTLPEWFESIPQWSDNSTHQIIFYLFQNTKIDLKYTAVLTLKNILTDREHLPHSNVAKKNTFHIFKKKLIHQSISSIIFFFLEFWEFRGQKVALNQNSTF